MKPQWWDAYITPILTELQKEESGAYCAEPKGTHRALVMFGVSLAHKESAEEQILGVVYAVFACAVEALQRKDIFNCMSAINTLSIMLPAARCVLEPEWLEQGKAMLGEFPCLVNDEGELLGEGEVHASC